MCLSFSNYLNKVFIFFIKKNKIDRLATKEWSYFVSSEIKKNIPNRYCQFFGYGSKEAKLMLHNTCNSLILCKNVKF